jgi:hypothetical protein
LFLLIGCDGGDKSDQEIYCFEVSYENNAWGFQHRGLFIDSNGDVFTYDVSSDRSDEYSETDTEYSESTLTKKFSTESEYKENIPPSTLQEMKDKIASANNGTLGDPISNANDAGIWRYKAFIYNSDNKTYKSVLLYQTGDVKITNSSSEAEELKNWLESIAMKYGAYFP